VKWFISGNIPLDIDSNLDHPIQSPLFLAAKHHTYAYSEIVLEILMSPGKSNPGRLRGDGVLPTLLHYVASMDSSLSCTIIDMLLDKYAADIDVVVSAITSSAIHVYN